MAMTYGDRVGLMYERDAMRREREHEKDYPIEDRVQAERKRQWESQHVRKEIGRYRPQPQTERPERSRISFFASDGSGRISRGDNSSGQMVIRDTNANGSDWGSVVAEDRAKKAADSVRQMLAEVDNADKQTRRNGEANDNILGGLAYAAMNMPFASDGNGGYSPRELTPDTIRRIVGDNPDWQGVSRVFMRKTKVGDAEVPLLWMEKDGKMQYFSPDQAGYAANLYTGGIAAANRALKGGTRGGGGGAASPWTGGTQQGATATKGNSRDRVITTAIQYAMKEYDGDKAAQEQYVSRMMEMYDKFAKGGEAEPQEQPQGLTDEERKAGVVIGSDGKKYANAKDMPKGVTVNMNPNAQPKPSNRNGVVDGLMGKRKPNAAPTVDEVAGSARFTGPQDVIEFERNGQVVTSAGWVGRDGKFYDSTGREIAGAKPVSEEAKKRLAKSDAFKRERAEFRRNALEERGFTKDEIAYLERNPQLVQKLIDEDNAAAGMTVPRAPTPNAKIAAKEKTREQLLAEKEKRVASGEVDENAKLAAKEKQGQQQKPNEPQQSQGKFDLELARRNFDLVNPEIAKARKEVDSRRNFSIIGKLKPIREPGLWAKENAKDPDNPDTIRPTRSLGSYQTPEEVMLRRGIAEGLQIELGGAATKGLLKHGTRAISKFSKGVKGAYSSRIASNAVANEIGVGTSRTIPRMTKSAVKAAGDLKLNDPSIAYSRMSKSQIEEMLKNGFAQAEWHVPQKVAKGVVTKFDGSVGKFAGGGSKGEFKNAIVTVKKDFVGAGNVAPKLSDLEGIWVSKGGRRVNILPELIEKHKITLAQRIGNNAAGYVAKHRSAASAEKIADFRDEIIREVSKRLGYKNGMPNKIHSHVMKLIDSDIDDIVSHGNNLFEPHNRELIIDGIVRNGRIYR